MADTLSGAKGLESRAGQAVYRELIGPCGFSYRPEAGPVVKAQSELACARGTSVASQHCSRASEFSPLEQAFRRDHIGTVGDLNLFR